MPNTHIIPVIGKAEVTEKDISHSERQRSISLSRQSGEEAEKRYMPAPYLLRTCSVPAPYAHHPIEHGPDWEQKRRGCAGIWPELQKCRE